MFFSLCSPLAYWEKHPETDDIALQQEKHRKATDFSTEEEEDENEEEENEEEDEKEEDSNNKDSASAVASSNPFALLADDWLRQQSSVNEAWL